MLTVMLHYVFEIPFANGMLASAFVIDMLIAIEYVLLAKKISKHGKVLIAIFRFAGDFFAWLCYLNESIFVAISGIIVTLLNLFYLTLCIQETQIPNKKAKSR